MSRETQFSAEPAERSPSRLAQLRSLQFWKEKLTETRLARKLQDISNERAIRTFANSKKILLGSLFKSEPVIQVEALKARISNTPHRFLIPEYGLLTLITPENPHTVSPSGERIEPTVGILSAINKLIQQEYHTRYKDRWFFAKPQNSRVIRPKINYKDDENFRRRYPSQYSKNPDVANLDAEQPVRRLLTHGYYANELIKCLYQIDAVVSKIPEATTRLLDEYSTTTPLLSIILIELMSELSILYDPRFRSLASQLRTQALVHGTPDRLFEQTNFATFTVDTVFWEEGTAAAAAKSERKQQIADLLSLPDDAETVPEYYLPTATDWDAQVRQLRMRERNIQELRPIHSIRTALVTHNGNKTRREKHVLEDKKKREELIHRQRQQTESFYRQKAMQYAGVFSELPATAEVPQTRELFVRQLQSLCAAYENHPQLARSDKSRKVLQAFATQGEHAPGEYQISIDLLMQKPLFTFLGKAYPPHYFNLDFQPAEHVLFTRLLIHQVLQLSVARDESSFLLTSTQELQTDELTRVQEFFVTLYTSTEDVEPREEEFLKHNYDEIADLLSDEAKKKRRKRTRRWQTEPLVGTLRIPYSIDISRKVLRRAAFVGGVSILLAGGLHFIPGIATQTATQPGENREKIPARGSTQWRYPTEMIYTPPIDASPEELKKVQPIKYLKNVHLPEGTSEEDETPIGFFPIKEASFEQETATITREKVSSFDDISLPPDALGYVHASPSKYIFPPQGSKITAIYETGLLPSVWLEGPDSVTYLTTEKYAQGEVFVVTEPLQTAPALSKDGELLEGITLYDDPDLRYEPYEIDQALGSRNRFDYQSLWEINQQITNPDYKELHAKMIDELASVVFAQNTTLTADALSEIIMRYTSDFYKAVQKHEHYALEPDAFPFETNNFFLQTANTEDGYYCAVAALSFYNFFRATGAKVEYNFGSMARYYDGEGWIHIGHVNNTVVLPNGKHILVDLTPPITAETPQEDIDALQLKGPEEAPFDWKKFLKELTEHAVMLGLSVTAAGLLFVSIAKLYKDKSRATQVQKCTELMQKTREVTGFNPGLQELLAALLAATLQENTQNPQDIQERIQELIKLLAESNIADSTQFIQWIAAHTGVAKDIQKIATQSAYKSNTTEVAQNILAHYQQLHQKDAAAAEALLPVELRSFFTKMLSKDPKDVDTFPKSLTNFVELATVLARSRVTKTTAFLLQGEHADTSITVKKAASQQKIDMLTEAVKIAFSQGKYRAENEKYLQWLLDAVSAT